MSPTDDLVLKVATLKVISAFTTEKYNEARREIAEVMERGDRKMARSPIDNAKIGAITLSDPKPTAQVSDLDKLTAWLAEHYPDSLVMGYEVCGSEEQVRRVLFEHAPEMLRKVKKIRPGDLLELRQTAAMVGRPMGPGGEADMPGITVDTPPPVVSCKPDETNALAAVLDLFRAERLLLDGTVRPELPAAEEPA